MNSLISLQMTHGRRAGWTKQEERVLREKCAAFVSNRQRILKKDVLSSLGEYWVEKLRARYTDQQLVDKVKYLKKTYVNNCGK